MITLLLTTIVALAGTTEPTFRPLFNGTDLTGWVNMNGDDSTWRGIRHDPMHGETGLPSPNGSGVRELHPRIRMAA